MIAAWMLISLLLGAAIVIGAIALDGTCRAMRVPTRWTWIGALGLLASLTILVPVRRVGDSRVTAVPAAFAATTPNDTHHAVAATSAVVQALSAARAMIDAPVARLARDIARSVPPLVDRWLLIGWIACSLVLLLVGVLVLRRLLRAHRTWPLASMHGERVHVAPDAGPAVLGFVRGSIIVPRWLIECSADVQEVVVAHEREHVRARDPVLLTLGALAVVLVPWNPAAWWMFTQLRLAVELDCDRRVLQGGVRVRDYGALLIDLAGRTVGISLGAPLVGLTMLTERTTHLERRIVAMTAHRPRHAAVRVAASLLVALSASLAACEARMPTSVDVQDMTASSAERAATSVGLMSAIDSLHTYYIDGRVATAAEARALSADRIGTIMVAVRKAGAEARDTVVQPERVVWIKTASAAETPHFERRAGAGSPEMPKVSLTASRFGGLVFIDGKRVDNTAMKRVNPADITGIEVTKGKHAAELYPNDPAAAQGVIKITTKRGAH